MATNRINPRVLLMSDSWLFDSRLIDASRFSFTQTLASVSEAVCFFHANSLDGEHYEDVLNKTLSEFCPNIIIALNSGCLRELLFDYAQKNQIAVITWFWDSPVLFGYEKSLLAKKSIVFLSDLSYRNHGAFENVGEWMPFSSIPAEAYERKPTKDICFQGTLWSMTELLNECALGLTCQGDGKFYYGASLYKALTEGLDIASLWQSSVTGEIYSYGTLLNALSALKRAKTLSWFANKDLHIYGADEWFTHLWNVAPELISRVQYREVLNHAQMRELFGDHRCSLNIFHLQNKLGGPNLRILDSATHFTPILSDYNEYCNELYPHGEAAFYFRDHEQALEGLQRILYEPGFGAKLANNAALILNAGHTHGHRIKTMFSKAEMAYEPKSSMCPIQVVSKTLSTRIFSAGAKVSDSAADFLKPDFSFLSKPDFDLLDRDKLFSVSGPASLNRYRLRLPGKLTALRAQLEESKARQKDQELITKEFQGAAIAPGAELGESDQDNTKSLLQRIKQSLSSIASGRDAK